MTRLLAPPLDLGVPLLGAAFLGAGALILLIVVIVLEAIIYRWMIPGGHSLRQSLLVNLASTVLGLPFFWIALPQDPEPSQLYFMLAATWILTIAVEALVLRLLRKQTPWRRVLLTSLVANIVSYLVLAGVLVAIMLPPW